MYNRIIWIPVLILVGFLLAIPVLATDTEKPTIPNATVSTAPPPSTVPAVALPQELENTLKMNQMLQELYGTWTTVITIAISITTLVGVGLPIFSSIQIDKKIKNAVAKMQKDATKANQKQLVINNALLLSASRDYISSNQLIEKLMKEYPADPYLDLLYGRNVFYLFQASEHALTPKDNNISMLESGVEHYLRAATSKSIKQSNYYELGAVFSDSIIHELCIMTGLLIDYSMEHPGCSNYHRLTRSVLQAIEDLLGLHSLDAFADEDPTNTHIMNYTILNHQLAKSYEHFGNLKAKAQYEYTLKLYMISNELEYGGEKTDCVQAVERLNRQVLPVPHPRCCRRRKK